MAIDEIENEIVETANKIRLNTIKGDCSIITIAEDNTVIDESEKYFKTDPTDDSDIICIASGNTSSLIIEDDNIQKHDFNLSIFEDKSLKTDKISKENLVLEINGSDLSSPIEEDLYSFCTYSRVRPPIRQYVRKRQIVVSNLRPNDDILSTDSSAENIQSRSDNKQSIESSHSPQHHVHQEQENYNGLKTLAELSDFLLSSEPSEVPTETTSVSDLHNIITIESQNNQEPSLKMGNYNQEVMDIKHEDINFHLKEIFRNSSGNTVEPHWPPIVVKMNEKPIIISENGVVSVIYKPEKVKLRRKFDDYETTIMSIKRSPRAEELREKKKTRIRKKICYNKSSEGRVRPTEEIKRFRSDLIKDGNRVFNSDGGKRRRLLRSRFNKKYSPIRKVKYEGEWVYKCTDCDFKHPNKVAALRRHMLRHQTGEAIEWFYCDLCDYRAKRKGNLKVHMILHRNPDEVVWYKCENCDKKFKHKNGLRAHEKRHIKREELEHYICNKCPYKTPYKHTLLRHKINHEPKDKKKLLRCSSCSYSTYNKYYFVRHKQTHGEPLYKCLMCSYEAKYKANLESHMKRHFPLEEIFYCYSCDFSTNRRYTLTLHNKNVHNIYQCEEDQMLVCYNCSFQTRFKRCLVKHMSIHCGISGRKDMHTRIKREKITDDEYIVQK